MENKKIINKKESGKISDELKQQAKMIVDLAKTKGLVKPHTAAFDKHPSEKEVHKGNEKYYLK